MTAKFKLLILLPAAVFMLTSCGGSGSSDSTQVPSNDSTSKGSNESTSTGGSNPTSTANDESNSTASNTSGASSSQSCETGEQLAKNLMSAINGKDMPAMEAMKAPATFHAMNGEYIEQVFKQLSGDAKVKDVVFSPTPVDKEAKPVDATDGDLLVNLSQPQTFPMMGNATLGNAKQVSLPAMKIDGVYRIHGNRGFGVSDFEI